MDIQSLENLEKWKKTVELHIQEQTKLELAKNTTTTPEPSQQQQQPMSPDEITRVRDLSQVEQLLRDNPKIFAIKEPIIEAIAEIQNEERIQLERIINVKRQMECDGVRGKQLKELNEFKILFKVT